MAESINDIIRRLESGFPNYERTMSKGGQRIAFFPWTAVRRILDENAPGWCFEISRVESINDRVSVTGRLSIPCAEGVVWREGIGQEEEPDEDEVVDMWSHVCSAVSHCMCSTRTEHERKSAHTEVTIIDCGTVVKLKYDHHEEKMTVVNSGGCPVEEILTGIDWEAELADLAAEILSEWQDGYEGDPHEAGLWVQAKREFDVATAHA